MKVAMVSGTTGARNRAGCAGTGRRRYRHCPSAPQDRSCAAREDNALLGTIICEPLCERVDLNADRSAQYLSRKLVRERRRRKRASSAIKFENTKCGKRFHDLKDINWRTDDCATVAFVFKDEVARHSHPRVWSCGH
jgi:hypothetical protein